MGTKYQPTERDRKMQERFQRQQSAHPKFQKAAGGSNPKKSRKK
jgi:hypothetical protein